MRWGHVFEQSEAEGHADLLTEFTRRARKLLDDAAARRNRPRMTLGVRVPQTMEECRMLGFDVGAWIQENLVDYVCPSDFFYTDFNARTEDFVKLAEGTNCKIYPSVHPIITRGNDVEILTAANYRAAANNFYAFGAHGVAGYNYQYNWAQMRGAYKFGPKEMWPEALQFVTQLGHTATIKQADRHYLFHPLWGASAPTGHVKNDRIVLDRKAEQVKGEFRFRLAEDLSDPRLTATLEFKAAGLVEDDRIAISLNGKPIASDAIERSFDADGQPAEEGRTIGPFFLYRIALAAPVTVFGDNQLSVQLTHSAGGEKIHIQEVEVQVDVR